MQKVTENVYAETEYEGCNCGFVITSEGVVMIDTPQIPTDAVNWREEIARHGKLIYLINSEPHGDHITGNYFFEGIGVAHEGIRDIILTSSVDQLKERMKQMSPESVKLLKGYYFRAPTITFSKNLTLYVGKHTFKLINLPGHTPYQTVVYVPEEKVIFTSDNVVNSTQPFMFAALPYDWLESLKCMQELDADWLVPGHGEVCKKDYLKQMSKNVQTWIDVANDAMGRGLSLEDAIKDASLMAKHSIKLGTDDMAHGSASMNLTRLYEVLKK